MKKLKRSAMVSLLVPLLVVLALSNKARASVTIIVDVGEITSGGSLVSAGTVLLISHGTDGTLNSLNWNAGASSFLRGDDAFFGAVAITNGVGGGTLAGVNLPTPGTGTQITGIFIKGLTSTDVSYSTGGLLNGLTFASSGGTVYEFGTYRNNAAEKFGITTATDDIGWVLPADGGTYNLSAYSGTGTYGNNDINANLSTSSTFSLVPEPTTASLMLIGSVGLVALRRLRKV